MARKKARMPKIQVLVLTIEARFRPTEIMNVPDVISEIENYGSVDITNMRVEEVQP